MPTASTTSPPQAPAIPAALQGRVRTFLEACEIDRNLSPLTIRQYELYLDHLLTWLSQRYPQVRDLADIDPDIVRGYKLALARHLNARTGRPLARATQTYFLIALRSLLRYWAMQGLEVMAPDRVELGKAQSRSLKFLDAEQMQRLLAPPMSPRSAACATEPCWRPFSAPGCEFLSWRDSVATISTCGPASSASSARVGNRASSF